MPTSVFRPLHIFICHSSNDKPTVRELYQKLSAEGWIDAWLDEEKLLPGQDWDYEIEKALDNSDAVIVILSTGSVSKEGYVQRELRFVLDIALEKPEGTIFILPIRLDNCERPRRLRSVQSIDYFPQSERDKAYQRLLASLRIRAEKLSMEINKPESRVDESESHLSYSSLKPKGSTLPYQPYFFGRETELATIFDKISPESRTWGVLIEGQGGIGKTSLAIEAAHRAPTEHFEFKFFVSAKVSELTLAGEKILKDFTYPNYFEMANEIATQLGEDHIPRLAPEERTKALWNAMRDKKVLLVYDNLETLHEDEQIRLFQFLSRLPEGNKAIVTSRHRLDVEAPIIHLDRLSANEAFQLMSQLAKNNTRLAHEDKKARRDLYEITNGHPLLIKWICGQLGRQGSEMYTIADACKFLQQAPKGNDPLEYIFRDLLETCTQSEIRVLSALTHFTRPAKLNWIATITILPDDITKTIAEDLGDRSLLIPNVESTEFFLPPLTSKFVQTRAQESVNETGSTLADRAYTLIMECGGVTNYEGFKTLDAEWPFIDAALPYLVAEGQSRLQNTCNLLYQFFGFTGRWDEAIELNQKAEEKALAMDDTNNAGYRAQQAALFYSFRNQAAEVLAFALRAEVFWKNAGPYEKALALRMRGIGHLLEKNYPGAIAAYTEALDLRRSIDPDSNDVAISLDDLAEAELANNNLIAAEQNYREALHIAKKNSYLEAVANTTGNLATLALYRGEWNQAEILAREALVVDEEIGRLELIALDCMRLAKALSNQKHYVDALPYARRAVEIYKRLRSNYSLEAHAVLAEIEQIITSQ